MTTQHTPSPWVTQGNGKVLAASNTILIADCIPQNLNFMAKNPNANAQHIVHCVNLHADLVAALTDVKMLWDDLYANMADEGERALWNRVAAVLAKAKGSAA